MTIDVETLIGEIERGLDTRLPMEMYSTSVRALIAAYRSLQATRSGKPSEAAWCPIADAPKNGTAIFAKVKDWNRGGRIKYVVLSYSINAYWETAYGGDQTFEDSDIIGWRETEPAALTAARQAGG